MHHINISETKIALLCDHCGEVMKPDRVRVTKPHWALPNGFELTSQLYQSKYPINKINYYYYYYHHNYKLNTLLPFGCLFYFNHPPVIAIVIGKIKRSRLAEPSVV